MPVFAREPGSTRRSHWPINACDVRRRREVFHPRRVGTYMLQRCMVKSVSRARGCDQRQEPDEVFFPDASRAGKNSSLVPGYIEDAMTG